MVPAHTPLRRGLTPGWQLYLSRLPIPVSLPLQAPAFGIRLRTSIPSASVFSAIVTQIESSNLVYGAAVDTTPPSVPQGIHMVDRSMTHVTFAWEPSSDDEGVMGYEIYLNGNGTPSYSTTTPAVPSLVWDHALVLANILAFDAAGNRSALSEMFVGSAERFSLKGCPCALQSDLMRYRLQYVTARRPAPEVF